MHVNPKVLEHPIIDDRPVRSQDFATSLAESLSFLAALQATSPVDVVHAQYLSFTSLAAVSFAKATGARTVVSSFGRDLSIGIPSDDRIRRMALLSMSGVDHILCPNQAVRRSALELAGQAGLTPTISIVPPSLDPSVLKAIEQPSHAKSDLIISTINSCFTPEKGVECILNAFAQILKVLPNATLKIAGADDHPEQINQQRLIEVARQLQLQEKVQFVGHLSRSAVGDLLKASRLFIDARTAGNFSSVLLEAQFLGTPTLCTDVPSARALITDGVNGVLFEPDNHEDIASKAVRLLGDHAQINALRIGALTWSQHEGRKYLESNAMSAVEQVYHSLLEGAPKCGSDYRKE